VTCSDHVPNPRCCGTCRPVFSTPGDEPGGAGRPVTAAARVPTRAGFLQQRGAVAPIGRPVTAADPPPLPPAVAPGVCADARAHRLERLSGLPLAASSLAWRGAAAGTSCYTFVGSSRRTLLVRTSRGTGNSAVVRPCRASVSSTDARTSPLPPRVSRETTIGWISSPRRKVALRLAAAKEPAGQQTAVSAANLAAARSDVPAKRCGPVLKRSDLRFQAQAYVEMYRREPDARARL